MIGPAGEPRTGAEGPYEGGSAAFGKYQLFASLGRGGMADVFLAVARGPMGFNKLAVIKRLRQALADETAFRNMFLDEARLAARLNHPNIVHTYEVGEQNGAYFIAMEYLEGQSLNKVLKETQKRREPIQHSLASRVIADALNGLHHAHELRDYDGRPLNIIHRDISPHNLFVTYEGHTKLVDFGIAKAALSSTETEVGVLKGKVAYMSPEQAMGGAIDCRADLFAMGIVLWELICGQRLMTGDSAAQTLHRLMNLPIPRASSVIQNIDPMLDDIIARALEKDPNYRFQTAAEMRDALEAYLSRMGQPARPDDVGRVMNGLFGKVREEVQRQIQRHMAVVSGAPSQPGGEVLTLESLKRLEYAGGNASSHLVRLNGTQGSMGSGMGSQPPSSVGSQYPQQMEPGSSPSQRFQGGSLPGGASFPQTGAGQQQKGSNAAVLLFGAGFFVLALALFAFVALRGRQHQTDVGSGGPSSTDTVVGTGPTTPASATTTQDPTTDPNNPNNPNIVVVPSSSASLLASSSAHSHHNVTPPPTHTNTTPTHPPTVTPPPPPPPPAEDPGFLTLQTYPWTRVYMNGKLLGTTPLNKLPLPPGSYTLSCENPDQGVKQSLSVTIKSGEITTKSPSFK